MWGGETVCQSISRSISLLRERGVCAVLRQQQCAHTSPKTSENTPTPEDESEEQSEKLEINVREGGEEGRRAG